MLLMLTVAAIVLVADQASKAIVISRLAEGVVTTRTMFGMRLCHLTNRRPWWRSLRQLRLMSAALLLLVIAGSVIARALEVRSVDAALGAMFGGAAGNLVDGYLRRGITDFIDLRVWPVFNLADAAIVAGAALCGWTAFSVLAGA